MKTIAISLAISLLIACAAFAADEPSKPEKPKPITEFPEEATDGEIGGGWGIRRNPKRTGKFEQDGDALKITAASEADMSYESGYNSPSSGIEVEGDFIAEVAIDPLPTDHHNWVGGGLLLFSGNKFFVRLNHIHNRSDKEETFNEVLNWSFTSTGGKLLGINLSSVKFDTSKPRIFRMERRGNRLLGKLSNDGVSWKELYPINIHGWPKKLNVGPFAINLSSKPKTVRFTNFKVTKTDK